MPIKIPSAPVRDAGTGEINTGLVGQQVQVVVQGTTTAYPIMDAASDLIPSSLVTVQTSNSLPTIYINTDTPADLYLDWYHAGSGARNEVDFAAALRDAAGNSAAAADAANTAAQGALSAAQALDAVRMKLAGAAVAQGANFWGVWSAGSAPIPPNDGAIHWGLEIVP